MGANPNDAINIKSLGAGRLGTGSIKTVSLLGSTTPLVWTATADGLRVTLPSTLPIPAELPPVIAVTGFTDIQWNGIVRQGQDNSFNLYATLADSFMGGVSLDVAGIYVTATNWKTTSDGVYWTTDIRTGGNYTVSVLSASPGKSLVGVISVQTQKVLVNIPQTTNTTTFANSPRVHLTLTAGKSVPIQFQLQSLESLSAPTGFQMAIVQIMAQ